MKIPGTPAPEPAKKVRDPELAALERCRAILEPLGKPACVRVLRFLHDRLTPESLFTTVDFTARSDPRLLMPPLAGRPALGTDEQEGE